MPSILRQIRGIWTFQGPSGSISLKPLQDELDGCMPESVQDLLKRIHGLMRNGQPTPAAASNAEETAGSAVQGEGIAQALIQALGHVGTPSVSAPPNGHRGLAPRPSIAMQEALRVLVEQDGAASSRKNRKSQWKKALGLFGDDWLRWDAKVVARKISNMTDYARCSKKGLRDSLRLLHTILTTELDYSVHDFASQKLRKPNNAQREAEEERESPKLPYSICEAREMIRVAPQLARRFAWLPATIQTAFLTGLNIVDIRELRTKHLYQPERFGRTWVKKRREKCRDSIVHVPVATLLRLPKDRRRKKLPLIGVPAGPYDALRELERVAGVTHVDGESWRRPRYLFASLLDQMGVPRAVRSRLMGHVSASVTGKYEKADDSDMIDAVESVSHCLILDRDARRAWQKRLDERATCHP